MDAKSVQFVVVGDEHPAGKLKDAKNFLHLLELTESEVERFKALVRFIGDRIGKLAAVLSH